MTRDLRADLETCEKAVAAISSSRHLGENNPPPVWMHGLRSLLDGIKTLLACDPVGAIHRALAAEARVAELEAERDALKAQLTDLEAQAAAMRDVLQDALSPESSGWWCPTCRREVPDTEVTYEGHHETCRTYVAAISSDTWRRDAKAALTALEGGEQG